MMMEYMEYDLVNEQQLFDEHQRKADREFEELEKTIEDQRRGLFQLNLLLANTKPRSSERYQIRRRANSLARRMEEAEARLLELDEQV